MPEYRYVGTVAREVEIGDKAVPLSPGDFVTLNKDEFTKATENGLQLIEGSAAGTTAKAAKEEGGE